MTPLYVGSLGQVVAVLSAAVTQVFTTKPHSARWPRS